MSFLQRKIRTKCLKILCFSLLLFCFACFLFHTSTLYSIFYHCVGAIAHFIHVPSDYSVIHKQSLGTIKYGDFQHSYLVDSHTICKSTDPFLVVIVKTSPENTNERMAIRKSWGNITSWPNVAKPVHVLFMLGKSKHDSEDRILQKVLQESKMYDDLIVDDFKEDFYNLTVKLVSQYKWMLQYCSNSKFFMSTDDDVYLHIENLVSYLEGIPSNELLYTGYVHSGSSPERDWLSKYYVPKEIYPGLYYPDYCTGSGYVLSVDVLKALFHTVLHLPLLYIDDVYTGLLAQKNGISPVHNKWFYGEGKVPNDWCYLRHFITSHGYRPVDLQTMHYNVLKNKREGVLCWAKVFT